MKVLILHNNNLPEFLLLDSQIGECTLKSISVALPATDIPDFDTHISKKLTGGEGSINLSEEEYDAIMELSIYTNSTHWSSNT